jgi:putative DNA primase/helicase
MSTTPATEASIKHIRLIRADQITPKRIRWLWPGRIPLGKSTAFSGLPGEAKSLTTIDMASRITTGRDFPDAPNPFGEPKEVLFLSSEDDFDSVIVPRLMAAGADLSRVHFVQSMLINSSVTKEERDVQLAQDAKQVKQVLAEHPQIVMFVIDPITDQTGEKAFLSDPEMRKLLRSVESKNVANVIVGHLNKKLGLTALQRCSGATAFIALSRAAWLFGTDAKDKSIHHMMRLKSNYALSSGLAFQIEVLSLEIEGKLEEVPRIRWNGASDADPTELLDTKANSAEAKAAAMEFLQKFLWDAPQGANDCEEAAEKAKISSRTLKRAKAALKVHSYRADSKDAKSPWMWRLPEDHWTEVGQ